MTFDNSFALDQMMEEAKTQMTTSVERLYSIEKTLSGRLGGRTRLSLMAAAVVSVAWAAAFAFAYFRLGSFLPEKTALPLLGVSLLLMALVVVGDFVHMKYYGTILDAQERLTCLRGRVEMGQNALSENLRAFREKQSVQWEMPLQAGASINQEASQIEAQLNGMETLSSGFIAKSKTVLYYVVCVAWAAAGSCSLIEFASSMGIMEVVADLGPEIFRGIMIAAIVISCIVEAVIAKLVWGKTDCEVTNVTLLAVLAGPVIFVALLAAVALIIVVVQIVLYLAALAIGLACVCGSIGGG